MFLRRGEEDRVQTGIHSAVRKEHPHLVLQVASLSDTTNKRTGASLTRKIDDQSFERFHSNSGQIRRALLYQFHPFFCRKQRSFFRVDPDGDDHAVEQAIGSVDDVDMPEGDRVEGAGVDRKPRVFGHRIKR